MRESQSVDESPAALHAKLKRSLLFFELSVWAWVIGTVALFIKDGC
ncbi:MAG TPA: hypothetical protein VFN18_03985 [Solirubrobacterales bacterium]|nr:hypothetical protein [Solirubrobacterales bacterium]